MKWGVAIRLYTQYLYVYSFFVLKNIAWTFNEHLHMFAGMHVFIVLITIKILILLFYLFFLFDFNFANMKRNNVVITQLRTYLNSLKCCRMKIHCKRFQ